MSGYDTNAKHNKYNDRGLDFDRLVLIDGCLWFCGRRLVAVRYVFNVYLDREDGKSDVFLFIA